MRLQINVVFLYCINRQHILLMGMKGLRQIDVCDFQQLSSLRELNAFNEVAGVVILHFPHFLQPSLHFNDYRSQNTHMYYYQGKVVTAFCLPNEPWFAVTRVNNKLQHHSTVGI
jgi:hypothetical protein